MTSKLSDCHTGCRFLRDSAFGRFNRKADILPSMAVSVRPSLAAISDMGNPMVT